MGAESGTGRASASKRLITSIIIINGGYRSVLPQGSKIREGRSSLTLLLFYKPGLPAYQPSQAARIIEHQQLGGTSCPDYPLYCVSFPTPLLWLCGCWLRRRSFSIRRRQLRKILWPHIKAVC